MSRVDELEVLEVVEFTADDGAHHIFQPKWIFSDVIHPFHEFVEEATEMDLAKEVA